MSSLIEDERTAEHLTKQLRESQTLFEISKMLAGTMDLNATLQRIADAATILIKPARRTVLHLLDDGKKVLRAVAVSGPDRPKVERHLTFVPGQGIAGIALETREVVNVVDVLDDPRYIVGEFVERSVLRSLLVAPICTGEKPLGTISVQSSLPGAFSNDDMRLLTVLVTQSALAIEKAKLLIKEREQLEEVDLLYHASERLSRSIDIDEVLPQVLCLLYEHLNCYHIQIYLTDIDSDLLIFKHCIGVEGGEDKFRGRVVRKSHGVIGHVAQTQQLFKTDDISRETIFEPDALLPAIKSELALPLSTGNNLLGVLDIQHQAPFTFSGNDIQLLSTIADQLAVTIEKANLYTDLREALNHEKETRMQLVQAEKLAALGRIIASVAHELNNPIQAIQNALYLIKLDETLSPQAGEDLQTVLDETERMAELINGLRETYRPVTREEFQLESVNVLVEEVQRLLSTHLQRHQIDFDFNPDVDIPSIPIIRDQIKQVVLNICLNAVEAMHDEGRITVRTEFHASSGGVSISIGNTGPPISPEILENIFDPFVTTKDRGTGLGLAITYDIIRRHNGAITVKSEPGEETEFRIVLPNQHNNNNSLDVHYYSA